MRPLGFQNSSEDKKRRRKGHLNDMPWSKAGHTVLIRSVPTVWEKDPDLHAFNTIRLEAFLTVKEDFAKHKTDVQQEMPSILKGCFPQTPEAQICLDCVICRFL